MKDKDVAVLVLYDDQKRMLLQHRTSYKKRWAEYWGTFGGGIEEGEEIVDALKREIHEELGHAAQNPILVFSQKLNFDTKHVFVEFYDGVQELTLNKEESQNMGWFTMEELLGLQVIPHDIDALKKVAEYIIIAEIV